MTGRSANRSCIASFHPSTFSTWERYLVAVSPHHMIGIKRPESRGHINTSPRHISDNDCFAADVSGIKLHTGGALLNFELPDFTIAT